MATYATATNQVASLKELYPGGDYMKNLVYTKNPLFALIPKDESPSGFAGKYIPVPMVYANPQGRSAAFSTAQSNQTAPALVSFFVYRVKNYQLVTIENELLEATKSDAGAFVDAAKLSIDGGLQNMGNNIATDLYGSGDGTIGTISSITSGVITLTNRANVNAFAVGQVLVSYSISGTTYTQSTSTALGYVIAVNRNSGTVTVSTTSTGTAGTPTNWSTSFPALGISGDVAFGSLTQQSSFLKLSGLAAWGPTSAVSGSDSFWGVNRSTDSMLQFTIGQSTSTETIEEALIDAASLVAENGGQPDMAFMNFTSYAALEKSLGSKVQYISVKHDEADIAFAGLVVNAPFGPISVIPDRNCTPRTCYLLQMDTLKLRSLGKAPHILTYGQEGLDGLRVGTADALEIRIGMYGNLICNAPGWNCVLSLAQ